jgi:hypothetical protein
MVSDRAKKLAAVTFLTLLIWVSVYLALEEDTSAWGTLNISREAAPDLLASFVGEHETRVQVRLTLAGPKSKTAEFRSRLRGDASDRDKISLEFYYNPRDENHTEEETYLWDVLAFLKNSDQIKGLGLTVVKCEPEKIEVKVEKLIEKHLPVQCIDERRQVLAHENITPNQVPMFVPKNWDGPAKVDLTDTQVARARQAPVRNLKPYIVLNSRPIDAAITVSVKLPEKKQTLLPKVFQATRIGWAKSITGKYEVKLLNEDRLSETTNFLATDEAIAAYQQQEFHLLIEVTDSDVRQAMENEDGKIKAKVIYNFPDQFVRRNEIQLNEPARQAEIQITPISAAPAQQ